MVEEIKVGIIIDTGTGGGGGGGVNLTMFAPDYVHILTQSRVAESLQFLQPSEDFDGVGCEWQSV